MYFNTIQWSHPSTTLLSGPSNSGKTSLLSKIWITMRIYLWDLKYQQYYSIITPKQFIIGGYQAG